MTKIVIVFVGKIPKRKQIQYILNQCSTNLQIQLNILTSTYSLSMEKDTLISVLTPLDFAMISRIKNRTSDSLQTALFHHLAIAESENYEITHILCDGEKVFLPSSMNCVPQGISLIPQDQVSTCLLSKEISERIRVYLQSIPYQLMFSLLRYLVEYVTLMLNL
jgi:hypothetical protein